MVDKRKGEGECWKHFRSRHLSSTKREKNVQEGKLLPFVGMNCLWNTGLLFKIYAIFKFFARMLPDNDSLFFSVSYQNFIIKTIFLIFPCNYAKFLEGIQKNEKTLFCLDGM